jgi:hypothetical protein
MLQYLSGGAWGILIRRLLEAGTRTLPMTGVLFLPLLVFGLRYIYLWARPDLVAHDEVLQHKSLYLNIPFFWIRAIFYFGIWITFSRFLNQWSLEQDQGFDLERARRLSLISGPGLVLYGLTVTFASIDWVMSLQPHWFSTIYGILFIGGQGLSALSFIIIVAASLTAQTVNNQHNGKNAQHNASTFGTTFTIPPERFHDLGKLLFAFVMLWAYFSFSQFLITWSGNLPEETPWYLYRTHGGWQVLALFIILFHFAIPFLLLLSRGLKHKPFRLRIVAAGMLFMRLVDLFWLIMPAFYQEGFHIHWMDIFAPIGLGAIWLAIYIGQLKERPLFPIGEPYLRSALNPGHH